MHVDLSAVVENYQSGIGQEEEARYDEEYVAGKIDEL
jgi:hypothetical protein